MLHLCVLLKALFTVLPLLISDRQGREVTAASFHAPNPPGMAKQGEQEGQGRGLNHTLQKLITNRGSVLQARSGRVFVCRRSREQKNERESVWHCRQRRSPAREFPVNTPQEKKKDFSIPLGRCCRGIIGKGISESLRKVE